MFLMTFQSFRRLIADLKYKEGSLYLYIFIKRLKKWKRAVCKESLVIDSVSKSKKAKTILKTRSRQK